MSTRLGAHGLPGILNRLLAAAGVTGELPAELAGRVELAVRAGGDGTRYRFVVNRTAEAVDIAALGGELLDPADAEDGGARLLPPHGTAVLRHAAG
ncbi:Beta-galactosidase C-terminal domain [Streptomonospora salina]|uniref:Beta-galactosidase C-terminal domain n=1 Tax=Streptomonospora salina TaxID=104205 RepID=UPI0035EC199D